MSQPVTPNLRRRAETLIEAINTRDFEGIAGMRWLDPEFEFRSALSATEGEFHVGAAGLREWKESMDSVWANFRVEMVDLRELNDGRAVVIYRATGEGRGSGVPLDTRTGQVWTFRDGKLWRNQSYLDPREALEAVGLSE